MDTLGVMDKILHSEADILAYLSEQDGGEVSAGLEGDCCHPSIGVPELLVRAALSCFPETMFDQQGHRLLWLESGDIAHFMQP